MKISKLASAIFNDIEGGLRGIVANPTISLLQLEDDVVDERLQIIKEYSIKNLIPRKDLFESINCVEVDCKSLDKCCTSKSKPKLHFQIPQVINDFGERGVEYIGAIDRSYEFKVYTDKSYLNHRYKIRGAEKPYIYIETTPNENNMYDGFIFNAPLLKQLSIIAIFKDPRQLELISCCNTENSDNLSFIDAEIKKRLTEKKIRYYKQLQTPLQPNNQVPS